MLMGVSAVKGFTSVKKMSEASVCIWRLWAVVTVRSGAHFFFQFLTSRRNMVFSAVNSLAAVHAISDSMLCSMLNSRACMEAFGFNSLFRTTWGDFLERDDVAEVRVSVSDLDEDATDDRRGRDLNASRSGMTMRTC